MTKKIKKVKEEALTKICLTAFELFATNGYVQTSVDSIAKKAKVSKGLIYYYFKSKDEILEMLFKKLLQFGGLNDQQDVNLTAKEKLQKMMDESFYLITQQTTTFRFIVSLIAQPDVVKGLSKEIEKMRKKRMGEWSSIFSQLGYEDPEMEAFQLCAELDGIGLAYLTIEDYPITKMREKIENNYNITKA